MDERGWVESGEAARKVFAAVERAWQVGREVGGFSSGFAEFDQRFGGFARSGLTVVGGRPGSGKSSLLRSIAFDAGGRREVPLAFVTSQGATEEAVMRMIGASGGIKYSELLAGDLEERQWAGLIRAVGILAEAPIYWIDTPGLAIDELEARCRELTKEHQIEALFIDSLHGLEGSGGGGDRKSDVEEILRGPDRLARELELTIVMSLSIDERCELRPDKRPFPAELRHAQIV